jgi:hypothetical protein
MTNQNDSALELEKMMEARDLPEGDRDEVRRFHDFLKGRKEYMDEQAQLAIKEGPQP